jgi:hypothetical protein
MTVWSSDASSRPAPRARARADEELKLLAAPLGIDHQSGDRLIAGQDRSDQQGRGFCFRKRRPHDLLRLKQLARGFERDPVTLQTGSRDLS